MEPSKELYAYNETSDDEFEDSAVQRLGNDLEDQDADEEQEPFEDDEEDEDEEEEDLDAQAILNDEE